jgi:hypothetical protein
MNAVQTSTFNPTTYRTILQPQTAELIDRHHAVLSRGKRIDPQIRISPPTGRFRSISDLL